MPVKNMLEKKKLNLNQPIPSVRRRHSTVGFNGKKIDNGRSRFSPYRPESKPIVPVGVAGSVPFHWEKAPGKPKENHDEANKVRNNSRNFGTWDFFDHDDDDDDEAFADALDTLSRIESFIIDSHKDGACLTGKSMHAPEMQSGGRPPQPQQRRLRMKLVYCDNNKGLRPRFCVKSLVCLVNPVPAKNEHEMKQNDKIQRSETKEKAILDDVPKGTNRCGSNRKTFRELLADQGSPIESLHFDTSNKSNSTRPFHRDPITVSSSSKPKTRGDWGADMAKAFVGDRDSAETRNLQRSESKNTKNVEKQRPRRSKSLRSEILVPPPSLKSPSDSWLRRTLPSMYAKNASRHSILDGSTESSKPRRTL